MCGVATIPTPLELGLKLEGEASWFSDFLLTAPVVDGAVCMLQLYAKSGHVTSFSVGGLEQSGGLVIDNAGIGKVGSPL